MCMLVRNEQSIIKENILYHKYMGVDRFIIMDHHSDDNTKEILEGLKNRGLDIEIEHQSSLGYYQAVWMNDLSKKAFRKGTDWIIPCDADEFWVINSVEKLPDYLGRVDGNIQVLKAYWHNCQAIEGKTPFYENIYFKSDSTSKVIYRSALNAELSMGNHSVLHTDKTQEVLDLKVMHFQYRDYASIYNKFVNGGQSYEASILPMCYGVHWKQGFDQYKRGQLNEYIKRFFYAEEDLIKDKECYRNDIGKIIRSLL